MLEGHRATACFLPSLKLLKLKASSSKSFWAGHHLAGFGWKQLGCFWTLSRHPGRLSFDTKVCDLKQDRKRVLNRKFNLISQENTSLKLWNLWRFRMLAQEILSVQSTMDPIHRPEFRVYPHPDSEFNRSSGEGRGCCWNHEHHSEHSRKYFSCGCELYALNVWSPEGLWTVSNSKWSLTVSELILALPPLIVSFWVKDVS